MKHRPSSARRKASLTGDKTISVYTLAMMDKAAHNLKRGKVSPPIHLHKARPPYCEAVGVEPETLTRVFYIVQSPRGLQSQ